MQSPESTAQLLNRLWRHIGPRRRSQFGLLLVLMVLASLAEILSIGAVLPFLGVLTAPDRVYAHQAVQPLIQLLALEEPKDLLLPLTIVFGFAALLAGTLRLALLWASTRLSFAAGADLSMSIYRRTLYQPYSVHVGRNSSEVISGISKKTDHIIYNAIMPVLTLISASILLSMILVALLGVDPFVALATFGGFGTLYGIVISLTRKRLQVDGESIARESTHVVKALQEGLGGIRDVLIDGTQPTYCQIYRDADLALRRAQGNVIFIAQSPRYGMEAVGMLLIATLAYVLAQQPGGVGKVIPVLGALALGAQRLLPILQQAYSAWSAIGGAQASLQDALGLLEQPLPEYAAKPPVEPLPFRRHIALKQLSFRYGPQTPWVLKNLDLVIEKGSRMGFIGTTGTGKSTLLDIVMGLLPPTDGIMQIDGQPITTVNHRAWQAHIAHVPQTIFLADGSIEENIAFGVPKDRINPQRVRAAAQQAQIADIIETWPEQYKTLVGERGVRLSGGQRQRVGIARALYKQADVIIFDEATSALDSETEHAVMRAIEGLSVDLTILIIAHRLSTLKNCTQVVELANCSIKRIGTFQEIITDSA